MSGKDILSKINPLNIGKEIEEAVTAKFLTQVKAGAAAALAEAPAADDLLDYKPIGVKVGPFTVPEFEIPIQLVRK